MQRTKLGMLLAATCLWTGTATADCFDYENKLSWLGATDGVGEAVDVAVDGGLAFVADQDGTLKVVDVSDLQSPEVLSSLTLPAEFPAWVETLDGHVVLAASSTAGARLHLLDVSDPTAPEISASITVPGAPQSMVIVDDLAYIACRGDGVQIVAIGLPDFLFYVGEVPTPAWARRVVVENSKAYVACDSSPLRGLFIADVTDPFKPVALGSLDLGDGEGVAVAGDYAYVSGSNALHVVDVQDALNPTLSSSMSLNGTARDMEVDESLLFTGCDRMDVFDISDPSLPLTVASTLSGVPSGGTTHGFDVQDGIVFYPALSGGGLQILDASFPSNAVPVSETTAAGEIRAIGADAGLAVLGITAPLGDAGVVGRVEVFDVSNPELPVQQGILTLGANIFPDAVEVAGSLAYVSGSGFHIIDISTPSSPVLRSTLNVSAGPTAISGNYAYFTNSVEFSIVDIENPEAPVLEATVPLGFSTAVAVSGDFAFATSANALHVLDVSDPTQPTFDGFLGGFNRLEGIVLEGAVAYLLDRDDGALHLVDISVPTSPVLIKTVTVFPLPETLRADGSFLAIGGGSGELFLNIQNPLDPVPAGWVSRATSLSTNVETAFADGTAFGSDDEILVCFAAPCEQSTNVDGSSVAVGPRLLQNISNPATLSSNVQLRLDSAAEVEVALFDAQGRLRSVLADGRLQEGVHDLRLAGDTPTALQSGVYFLRASLDGVQQESHRVVILK